jgi:hypothetical protein
VVYGVGGACKPGDVGVITWGNLAVPGFLVVVRTMYLLGMFEEERVGSGRKEWEDWEWV